MLITQWQGWALARFIKVRPLPPQEKNLK